MMHRIPLIISLFLLVQSAFVLAMSSQQITTTTKQIRTQISHLKKMIAGGKITSASGQKQLQETRDLINKIKPYDVTVARDLELELAAISEKGNLAFGKWGEFTIEAIVEELLGDEAKNFLKASLVTSNPEEIYRPTYELISQQITSLSRSFGLKSNVAFLYGLDDFRKQVISSLQAIGSLNNFDFSEQSLLEGIQNIDTDLKSITKNMDITANGPLLPVINELLVQQKNDLMQLTKDMKAQEDFLNLSTRFLGGTDAPSAIKAANTSLANFKSALNKDIWSGTLTNMDITKDDITLESITTGLQKRLQQVAQDVRGINQYVGENIVKQPLDFYHVFSDAVQEVYEKIKMPVPFSKDSTTAKNNRSFSSDMKQVLTYIEKLEANKGTSSSAKEFNAIGTLLGNYFKADLIKSPYEFFANINQAIGAVLRTAGVPGNQLVQFAPFDLSNYTFNSPISNIGWKGNTFAQNMDRVKAPLDAMQSIKKEIIDWAKASKPNNAQQLKDLFDKAKFTVENFTRMQQLIDTIITSINAVMPFTQEELS